MKKDKKENIKTAVSGMPDNCLLEVAGHSGFGDLMAKTVDEKYQKHKIYIMENRRIKPALQTGDRFIADIINKKGTYWAKPITRTIAVGMELEKVQGVVVRKNGYFVLKTTAKNSHQEYKIVNYKEAKDGDFVIGVLTSSGRFPQFEIKESLGKFDVNKSTSGLVLDKYEIPYEFPASVIREANKLAQFNIKLREDLTHIPFVTIDGEDSRDFDDAIYASKTAKGFELLVAIADVAFYVKPSSELDREAYRRGNSVYLPNMVIPMLPEMISNDLCSLRPKENRASLVCFINIDNLGNVINYNFKRAVIKSHARLTYQEVQNAIDGKSSANILPLFKNVIQPIYEAYFALDKARKTRGALELESNEIKIKIDKNGLVSKIEKFESLTAHKIIEEFMVTANVCAAKALKKTKLPIMFRIHESPLEEKLKDIKPLLKDLGLSLPDAAAIKPEHFNKVLELCAQKGYNSGISDLILRLQCQAKYSPNNLGHFGLGLEDYAHFTSPIRRYSDLLVHRALVKAYKMPEGGELEAEATMETFKEIGDHISATERKAVSAEREMVSRFLALYLEPSIGQDFEVKVSGMATAGLFVRIESIGAEGLIPMRSLPDDNYEINSSNTEMFGSISSRSFALGDAMMARLIEASPINGGMIFKFIDKEQGVDYYEKGGNNRRKLGAQKTEIKKSKFKKVKGKAKLVAKDKDKSFDKDKKVSKAPRKKKNNRKRENKI